MLSYTRRPTVEVKVGSVAIGGNNPVRVQSMASTSTMDTDGSVAQAARIIDAGAEILRFTAQGVREAENLAIIRQRLRDAGYTTPLVADIHFNPRAAFAAAHTVEKVRINPGNFVDPGRTFRKIEFTDEEYAAELRRLEDALVPFLDVCRENDTAIRLGVNHGSLSDRIMSRFGDTPAGMVESAMEFLRVCVRHNFHRVVISIKASNVVVMVTTVLLLVEAMDREDMHFPLHLGVTEAGDGEDARIKSALGIGSLLALGIGDTIRVSLSEEPECEIPVARSILAHIDRIAAAEAIPYPAPRYVSSLCRAPRRKSKAVGMVGGANRPVVAAADPVPGADPAPDIVLSDTQLPYIRLSADEVLTGSTTIPADTIIILSTDHPSPSAHLAAALHRLDILGMDAPVILSMDYPSVPAREIPLRAAIDLGPLLLRGYADGIMLSSTSIPQPDAMRIAFAILQSARLRFTRTEYISCPGCGRTLFDLRSTLARVKEATSSLVGLKIGVMGCIVNGPGEMADADYGYVGAGVGKVSLYKGRQCIERNIPTGQAVERLVKLIKDSGDWK